MRPQTTTTRCEALRPGESGLVLISVLLVSLALMVLAVLSVQASLDTRIAGRAHEQVFQATEIAESGIAHALVRLRGGAVANPVSGGGTAPRWVDFSKGQYLYYTTGDAANGLCAIRAWGRVARSMRPSRSDTAPDSPLWDGDGWLTTGIELVVKSSRYIPDAPLLITNGGVERPLGGHEWPGGESRGSRDASGARVTSWPSSRQSGDLPFQVSALDHAADWLTSGGEPVPATASPHPYAIWTSENAIGQLNAMAWFRGSHGDHAPPDSRLAPPPAPAFFDTGSLDSPGHAFRVDPAAPVIAEFVRELWVGSESGDVIAPVETVRGADLTDGQLGDLEDPRVALVTGTLRVAYGKTLRGAGILAIRDAEAEGAPAGAPPGRALLDIAGRFEWTGLVIVCGRAPSIDVRAGGSATIVGALFAEDCVPSGNEPDLESAGTLFRIEGPFRLLYSSALFRTGGIVHRFLPWVGRETVAIREI